MKKILQWILIPILIFTLAISVSAQTDILKMTDVTAQKGETVFVTVELTQSIKGDSMGVSYSYNEKDLKPIISSCNWVKNGVLQNFDNRYPLGVWTVSESIDLKGGICVLAFEVLPNAKFSKTEVFCTVTIKKNGDTVGNYSATSKVVMGCEHTYGEWTNTGDIGHSRECKKCKGKQTQSHTWGKGVITSDPSVQGANVVTYTCQICRATKKQFTSNPENTSAVPGTTEVTSSHVRIEGTSVSPYETHSHQSHGGPLPTTPPIIKPGKTTADLHAGHTHATLPTLDNHDGHDHDQTQPSDNRWGALLAIDAVIVALVIIIAVVVKKFRGKRKRR